MNYELAKKLKDAKFPYNAGRRWDLSEYFWLPCTEMTLDDREKCWIPNLSELIAACGDDFVSMLRHEMHGKIRWCVHGKNSQWDFFSPEEAVANLWLELNK